jgi:hypothetical protein
VNASVDPCLQAAFVELASLEYIAFWTVFGVTGYNHWQRSTQVECQCVQLIDAGHYMSWSLTLLVVFQRHSGPSLHSLSLSDIWVMQRIRCQISAGHSAWPVLYAISRVSKERTDMSPPLSETRLILTRFAQEDRCNDDRTPSLLSLLSKARR